MSFLLFYYVKPIFITRDETFLFRTFMSEVKTKMIEKFISEGTIHNVSIICAAAMILIAFSLVFCFIWWAERKHKRGKARQHGRRRSCASLPTYDELFL